MLLPESVTIKPVSIMPVTIKRIATTVFRLPMLGALRWGKHSALDEVRHVLVQVELSDGSTGHAEAPPRPTIYGETAASITAILRDEIAPRVTGIPLAQVYARMHEIRFNHAAKGALDIALHDAIAHSRGIALAEHLGCVQERVRVSYILGIGTRDEVLAEAVRVVEQGVRVLKVKVGRAWGEDLAHIEELQHVLGAEVALYADANECMTRDDAAWKLDALRERGLLYCEEPLPVQQIQARAALRAEYHLPLIADDSAFTVADLERNWAWQSVLGGCRNRNGQYSELHCRMQSCR